MNNDNTDETAHDAELDELWHRLEAGLAAYLGQMTDPDEQDHLLLEVPNAYDGEDDGCAPYIQFAAFGDGHMVRAEVAGNTYLHPQHRLDESGCHALRFLGWQGHDDENPNWFVEVELTDVDTVAEHVVTVLQHHFGVAHPQLLTHQAWGPAAEHVELLGLLATEEIPAEQPPCEMDAQSRSIRAESAEHLHQLIGDVLRAKYDEEPVTDEDDDYVIVRDGQPVYVRPRQEQPAVEVIARVAHGVRSRRDAAVELAILNRSNSWIRWELHDRDVFQTIWIPARPFVPRHLDELLDVYLEALTDTRDDLALRLRAEVA